MMLDAGECEPLKRAVHGAALGLALVMGGYNAAAFVRRREWHLLMNTIVYGSLVIFEAQKVTLHAPGCTPTSIAR